MTAVRRAVLIVLSVLAVVLAAIPTPPARAQAPAQRTAPPTNVSPVQRAAVDNSLAPGERYAVTARRGQVYVRYDGSLVAASSEWLLLRRVSEVRNDSSNEEIGIIPYFQHKLKTSSVAHVPEQVWIPRSAISQCERLTTPAPAESAQVVQAAVHEAPRIVAPKLGADCSIDFADGNKAAIRQGKLSKLAGDKLTLTCQVVEIRERPTSGAARVPIFGDLFTEQQVVKKPTLEIHSLDTVLAIRVPFELPDEAR